MKTIYYLLLINVICGFETALMAQNKPESTPKVYKSTPVQTSNPRIKSQQGAPVATPNQPSNNLLRNNNSRPTTSPVKDSVTQPALVNHSNELTHGGLVNFGFAVGIPRGEFKDASGGDVGFGFDVTILANLSGGKRSAADWRDRFVNVYVGGNFQYLRQNGITDNHTEENSFSVTSIESKVVNNMYALNVVSRIEFFPGLVKLFAEASAGGRLFNGVHKLHVEDVPKGAFTNPNDTRITDYRNGLSSSVVGNISGGGGIRVGSDQFKVELKVMYVKGTTANYVDIESVKFDRNTNSATYTTQSSTTDMIIPQLSVSVGF